jgi:uncharacterized protein
VHPVPGLECVAVVAPPIDMARTAAVMAEPRNRLYEVYFLTVLLQQQRDWRRLLPDLPPLVVPQPLTMRRYDELYVAAPWGFADVDDYHRHASSGPLIPCIQVPTLILTARDDPFIPAEPFEELKAPGHVEVHIERYGGHLGFVGGTARGLTWADEYLVRWVLRDDLTNSLSP